MLVRNEDIMNKLFSVSNPPRMEMGTSSFNMATSADEVVETQDLESKLTKTILNLEEIDTNLYRYCIFVHISYLVKTCCSVDVMFEREFHLLTLKP